LDLTGNSNKYRSRALSHTAYLTKLQSHEHHNFPCMSILTLNCLIDTGAFTAGTCSLKYLFNFSLSILALTSPNSPPTFFVASPDIFKSNIERGGKRKMRLWSNCTCSVGNPGTRAVRSPEARPETAEHSRSREACKKAPRTTWTEVGAL
jgi:hypothetical protein